MSASWAIARALEVLEAYDLSQPCDPVMCAEMGVCGFCEWPRLLVNAMAEAWDEGERAGFTAHYNYSDAKPSNPYRNRSGSEHSA